MEYYVKFSVINPVTNESRSYTCKESLLQSRIDLAASRNLILVVESEKEQEDIWSGFAEYY